MRTRVLTSEPCRCARSTYRQGRRADGRADRRRCRAGRAALHASRRSMVFRTFRNRLEANGKPRKAAITAIARKLLGVLNAMLATDADYRHDVSA